MSQPSIRHILRHIHVASAPRYGCTLSMIINVDAHGLRRSYEHSTERIVWQYCVLSTAFHVNCQHMIRRIK